MLTVDYNFTDKLFFSLDLFVFVIFNGKLKSNYQQEALIADMVFINLPNVVMFCDLKNQTIFHQDKILVKFKLYL